MAVIDGLTAQDLKSYRNALIRTGNYEKSCGFICGKDELLNWNPLEICHILNTTVDYFGRLSDIVPRYSRKDVADYVKVSVGNLYHALCHRYIYSGEEKSIQKLPLAQRDIFFILQNLYFLETGYFPRNRIDMREKLNSEDRKMWDILTAIQNIRGYDFDTAFATVLEWCGRALARADRAVSEADK